MTHLAFLIKFVTGIMVAISTDRVIIELLNLDRN